MQKDKRHCRVELLFFKFFRRACCKTTGIVPRICFGTLVGSVVDVNVDHIKCEKVFVVDKFYFVCIFNLLEMRLVNNK
jgi:hypothetical protein